MPLQQLIGNIRHAGSQWSVANPNGSLAVWGVLLMTLPGLINAGIAISIDLSQYVWQPIGQIIQIVFNTASTLFVFVVPLCFITGAIAVPVAAFLAFRDYRKRRAANRVNPSAPAPDAPSESN